jgi:hypothetical protein
MNGPTSEKPGTSSAASAKGPEALRTAGFVLLIAGLVFKIQHWPLADTLIVGAWIITVAAMVWRLVVERSIGPRTLLRDMFRLALISLLLLHMLHLPGRVIAVFLLITCAGGILWIDRARLLPGRSGKPWLFYPGMVSIVLGTLFRIQHWPFSTGLLLTGVALIAIWFLTSWGERQDP